jgi:phosphonate transport system substrate-binding protein
MKVSLTLLMLAALLSVACAMVQPAPRPLGTEQNPVKLALAPTTDTPRAFSAGKRLSDLLERETGLHFSVSVPTSYAATLEAMATHNLDLSWLSPQAYLLAHERTGTEALAVQVRDGSTTSTGQIVVRADSGITSLEGLRGTRFAFSDDRSLVGYHATRALLLAKGLDPSEHFIETAFVDGDDRVALAVYGRQVDGGAIAGDIAVRPSGAAGGQRTVFQPLPPDLGEQLRAIGRTDPVPNDVVGIRKGVTREIGTKIREGLLRVAASPPGAATLQELYGVEGLAPATDADFAAIRAMVALLDLDLDAELPPRRHRPR